MLGQPPDLYHICPNPKHLFQSFTQFWKNMWIWDMWKDMDESWMIHNFNEPYVVVVKCYMYVGNV